jgi:hypothetical protein
VKRETGPVKERAGVGPAFRSSVTPASPDQAFKKQIKEVLPVPHVEEKKTIIKKEHDDE